MIVKRTGNGQTECTRCKEKGKWALNWDSFLYTFNDKPYCFDCLMEMLEEKENIIKEAIKYINHYENIRAYYSYSEDGYEEYNYDDDFKEEIINLLKGEMENE